MKMIIGIDPDTEKNGLAIYHARKIHLHNWSLFGLFDFMKANKTIIEKVVIENGEMNRSLWNSKGNFRTSLNIAMKTGKNFDRTDVIAEMCVYLDLKFEYYVPTSEKYSHDYACRLFGYEWKRTNQEQRDALRCIAKYIL
jgi:hypothetical protein